MGVRIIWVLMLFCVISAGPAEAASPNQIRKAFEALLEKFGGGSKKIPEQAPAPKQLDHLGKSAEPHGALFWRSGLRVHHYQTCPSMRLRVSLPQLNVLVQVPPGSYIRRGPGKQFNCQILL